MEIRLKITFLSTYSGLVARGVETYVHELANKLLEKGYEIDVIQNGPKLPNSKYKTISLNLPTNLNKREGLHSLFINYYALKVKQFTQQALNRIDSQTNILVPTNGQWQSFLCKIWAVKNKKKIVIPGQSGPGIDDRINLLSFPDAFVTLTEYQRRWAEGANPFVRVVKIPNGVDLEKFKPGKPELKFNLPKPIILCVAALTFWKRVDLAIKAVSALPRGSLVVVGIGEAEKKLQKLGGELLPGRFLITSLPHHKIPQVYKSADLFTFPTSPFESFGIVMLEAMATNIPVIAADDPIRREIVGAAGLFVNPKDTRNYTQTLSEALKTNWGDKPRKQAEKFSWDKIAKQYDNLFKDLIK